MGAEIGGNSLSRSSEATHTGHVRKKTCSPCASERESDLGAVTESNPITAKDSWNVRLIAAMIRCLWLDACGHSSGGAGVEARHDPAPASLSLLPLSGSGQCLDAADRDKLRKNMKATTRKLSLTEQHFLALAVFPV